MLGELGLVASSTETLVVFVRGLVAIAVAVEVTAIAAVGIATIDAVAVAGSVGQGVDEVGAALDATLVVGGSVGAGAGVVLVGRGAGGVSVGQGVRATVLAEVGATVDGAGAPRAEVVLSTPLVAVVQTSFVGSNFHAKAKLSGERLCVPRRMPSDFMLTLPSGSKQELRVSARWHFKKENDR